MPPSDLGFENAGAPAEVCDGLRLAGDLSLELGEDQLVGTFIHEREAWHRRGMAGVMGLAGTYFTCYT